MVTPQTEQSCLLTINGGSSSLKFALFRRPDSESSTLRSLLRGKVERIGLHDAYATVTPEDDTARKLDVEASNLRAAADWLIDWLDGNLGGNAIAGIAHRVVHGGPKYVRPDRITAEVIEELKTLRPMDPDHLPGEIAVIERFHERLPEIPQMACFDTAFHHDLPRVAQILPIPRRYQAMGIRRYGFHGLSFTYLMEALARVDETVAASGRVVLAHLGSGASLAAVHAGRPVETTMALTPAAGIVMSTRSGDIDPGLPGYLARAEGMTPDQFDRMINHESGLLGVSETSPDIRDLMARRDRDPRASEAIDLFAYSVRKAIGAMAAALGGLDVLVFSGGIGENADEIRARVCDGLEFLGIAIDPASNAANASLISTADGRVPVRVIPTDEESVMARQASALLSSSG